MASKMYQGALFRKSLDYCLKNFDEVFILSAKYGLVCLTDFIVPYEMTLNKMKKDEIKSWSDRVKEQLKQRRIRGEFFFFTGKKYHCFFNGKKPLEGLSLGKQLRWFIQQKEKRTGLLY